MEKNGYQRYLQSPQWGATGERRLTTAGHRCEFRPALGWGRKLGTQYGERCTTTQHLNVHHRHYRTRGAERAEDLEVLCRFHHLARHVTSVECDCGEIVQVDDNVTIEIVKEAIAGAGGIHSHA